VATFPSESLRSRIAETGTAAFTGSPAEFGKLIAEETEKWAKVVKFSRPSRLDATDDLGPPQGGSPARASISARQALCPWLKRPAAAGPRPRVDFPYSHLMRITPTMAADEFFALARTATSPKPPLRSRGCAPAGGPEGYR